MSERIRVAQVITRFMAGAGGVALRGALALDPDRYEVTVLAGSGNRLIEEATAAGIKVVMVDSLRPEIMPTEDWRALRQLEGLLGQGRFDVVHTHSSKSGALGRLAAHRVGVPMIVHTFHGFPFHEFQSRSRRAGYVAIERYLGRYTHAFLAVGTSVAAEAIRRGIASPDRVRTIGVAVDTASPAPTIRDRAEARRLLGVPPGTSVVGTVGRLDYQKAPEDLVRAVAATGRTDVFGVWIGDGPLRVEVAGLVARLGLTSRFRLLGERSDVPALLPGLDVFAMASRYEGLPCSIVEAMTAGLPVVATAVNSVPDVVVPGETGLLVPPGRPDLLGGAIRHLIEHPWVAARLGANGRAALGDRLSPAALGDILDQTYRGADALDDRRPVGPHIPLREAV
jgi:glycosyltransferase involved in cell wall biosynthesis